MKKKLVASLAAAMVLGVAGTSFAAANPFVDVPAKHWAYDAVNSLAKAGIIDGTGNGKFDGSSTLTRYEIAQIVAKALAHSDKADAAQKAEIKKLATEFSDELNNLGVRVEKLEKNAGNIKITGWDRMRYQQNDTMQGISKGTTKVDSATRFQNDFKLNLAADVNDSVSFEGALYLRTQTSNDKVGNTAATTVTTTNSTRDGYVQVSRLNATFKNVIANSNLTLGRQNIKVSNGYMLFGDYFDGAKATFGSKKLNGFIAYGDYSYMPGPTAIGVVSSTANVAANNTVAGSSDVYGSLPAFVGNLQYTMGNTTLYAGYMNSANNNKAANIGNVLYKDTDFGFSTQLGDKVKVFGEYVKNSDDTVKNLASDDTKSYYAGIQYDSANLKNVGSRDVYVKYLKRGYAASDWRGSASVFGPSFKVKDDVRGIDVGYEQTLAKNTLLQLEYLNVKAFSKGALANDDNEYRPFVSAAVSLWF